MSSPQNDRNGRLIPLIPDSTAQSSRSENESGHAPLVSDAAATEKLRPQIVSALSSIFDPEIPVNIYELGLIYDIQVDANAVVDIQMTLTAPGCPSAQIIPMQVEQRVRDIPDVKDVR